MDYYFCTFQNLQRIQIREDAQLSTQTFTKSYRKFVLQVVKMRHKLDHPIDWILSISERCEYNACSINSILFCFAFLFLSHYRLDAIV